MSQAKPVIGISLGDINGIGPEVIIKTLSDQRILNKVTPIVYGSTKALSYYRKMFDLEDFNYHQIKEAADHNAKKVNVINCWDEVANITVGQETEEGGKYAFIALEKMVEDAKNGFLDAMVTAPLNKNLVQAHCEGFIGHTEYLAEQFEAKNHLMFMCGENMRMGLVTAHVPLAEVSATLTRDLLTSKIESIEKSLKQDFAITKPKIAILGLNPHAGESGILGDEEINIINPVIQEMLNKRKIVMGPYASDGFFGGGEYRKFDAILAMYHDQGLIPFKTIDFETGVNFTAGLSIVRTSPDHGTAYNIAGKYIADESSMRNAIFLAADITITRSEQAKLEMNSLKNSKK
ncbi:MAG: 4-hydroxythreonine-4-phosphate dehydrogenase PdxA [Cyclobacteriaceae bacterium]|nr:4-hydroxythreonine-4-phosphate dehydrogenase PdxA [Cyclobacteriaceae bacterium]MCH8516316.1 4-hydroxythreonine-4-phosphate dehydrogenase PdxA [Cyclobacteriaceae bacterium]